jgi:hypothetical protein
MKKCLQCEQVYGDETNFCLSDGSTLVSVSVSFTSGDETPTVYSNSPAPTVYSGAQFVPPVIQAPPAPKKSRAPLIVAAVGLFLLLGGAAVAGLVIYALKYSDKKDTNIANAANSADKSNKNAAQKPDNDNLAQNLKQQQDKLDKDKQKLEDERKALEAKKKEATPTPTPGGSNESSSRTATVTDPPTNVRLSPNGAILCVIRQRMTINILGSTGVRDNNGTWYYTDACGSNGVIHSSQIRF